MLRVAGLVHRYAVLHPLLKLLGRHASEVRLERSAARCQAFVGHTRAEDILPLPFLSRWGDVLCHIHQHIERDVAIVFLRKRSKDVVGQLLVGTILSERLDGSPISASQCFRAVGGGISAECLVHIGDADAVFRRKAFAVGACGIGTHIGLVVLTKRRYEVELERCAVRAVLVHDHSHQGFLADTHFLEAELAALACPDNQVALAARQRRLALRIALFRDDWVEFCVVVKAVIDRCTLDGKAVLAQYGDDDG